MKQIFFLFFVCTAAHAEHTRVTYPNALGVQVLGRGMLLGLQYDRVLNDDLAAGIAYGKVGTEGDQSADLLPVFINYYFSREQDSLLVTAGLTAILNAASVKSTRSSVGSLEFPSIGMVPTLGVGFESRTDNGFLFRAEAYGMVGANVTAWPGVTIGYCF